MIPKHIVFDIIFIIGLALVLFGLDRIEIGKAYLPTNFVLIYAGYLTGRYIMPEKKKA